MTFVSDLAEAKMVMSVLESGPDGVIMTPRSTDEVEALGRLCNPMRGQLALKEFAVTEIADAGTGDRVCVDTCSNFFLDEGLLVGRVRRRISALLQRNPPASVHADASVSRQRRRRELVYSARPSTAPII